MIKIIDKKSERTKCLPLPWIYNAEITIEENNQILYIHVNMHTETFYTLSEKSIFDYMTYKTEKNESIKFIEEYTHFNETKHSKYAKYFEIAEKMIDDLIKQKRSY